MLRREKQSSQTDEKSDQALHSSLQVTIAIVTGMLVTLVTVAYARLAFGLILPFMRADLGISYQQAGALGTGSALGYLFLVLVAGALASRRGGRAAVVLGVILTTAGFTGLAYASDYRFLLFCMVLLGCGTAFAYTPVISLLAGCFPKRRGVVIGAINSGIGVGMLIASALVPYLTNLHGDEGWRYTCMSFAAASAVTLIASLLFLPNPPLLRAPAAAGPVTAIFRERRLILVGMLYGVVGLTYIAQSTFMYSFALDSGLSASTAGRLAALMGILSVFAAPGWGLISDRIGRPAALMAAVTLTLVGTAIPVIWPTLAGFTAHYIILGCTVSGMFTSILAVAAESVEAHRAPQATSFVTVFFAVGQLAGPVLSGVIIDRAGGFEVAFAASCVVLLFGVFLAWRLSVLSRPGTEGGARLQR